MEEDRRDCVSCANRLSWVGLWDSLLIAVFKGVIGYLTRSRALQASALYSVHDVFSSIAIIIGLKVSPKPADEEHPYGHGNVEHIVSVLTSFAILGTTVYLTVDSLGVVLKGKHIPPHWAALVAAMISCFANEIIYHYNICAVRHLNSPAILAHAKHHRADAISSLAVVVAIVGTKMGYHFLDPLVAVFEGIHLTYMSMEILYHGGAGLMDRSVGTEKVSVIRKAVLQISDVKKVLGVRTRQIGSNIWVDLNVSLSPQSTIAKAGEISNRIRRELESRIRHLGKVNVILGEQRNGQ